MNEFLKTAFYHYAMMREKDVYEGYLRMAVLARANMEMESALENVLLGRRKYDKR